MCKLLIRFLFGIIFCLHASSGRAEESILSGRFFSDPKVVSSSYNEFCLDKEGFLWIGTNNGLLRFDGSNYDSYRYEESIEGSLSDNRVLNILCDSGGRLWVGTANGMNLYDKKKDAFSVLKLPNENINGYIIDCDIQEDGTVTFIASGLGMYVIGEKNGSPEATRYLSPFPDEKNFNSIFADKNTLYVGTVTGNVYRVAQNGKISQIFSAPSYITDIKGENDGNIIFATISEIFRYNPTTEEITKLITEGPIEITGLSDPNKGKIYLGTNGMGLWEIIPGNNKVQLTKDVYSPYFDITNSRISNVSTDAERNMWLGFSNYGIMQIPSHGTPFQYRRFKDINPNLSGIMEFSADWKGNIVVGFDNGEVAVFNPSMELLKKAAIPDGSAISSMIVLEDTAFLGVANSGVWEMDLRSGRLIPHLLIPGKYRFIVIGPEVEGSAYIAVHGTGIYKHSHQGPGLELISKDKDGQNMVNPFINDLFHFEDKLLIGHYNGIDMYDFSNHKFLPVEGSPLEGISVFSIEAASDSLLLIGTSKGLYHYFPHNNKFIRFTTAQGLTDNSVKSLAVDKSGKRWIATMKGLSVQHPEDNMIEKFYGGNGLVETEYNSITYDPEGERMYLGGNLGLAVFHPDSIPMTNLIYPPVISAFLSNGERIPNWEEKLKYNTEQSDNTIVHRVELPYYDNSLSIRLAMKEFRDNTNLVYEWRMGNKEEWSRLNPENDEIHLSHLIPGKHLVQIRAEENNKYSPICELLINITPPWYLTIWAKIIYILILCLVIVLGWILMEKKRDEKINDAKLKYFVDISHDIRSPITLILNPLEQLMKKESDSDTHSKLKLMHRNAVRIISLVNQMLDIRKIEKGKMRLFCRKTDLQGFVSELIDLFSQQAKEKGIELRYIPEEELPDIWLDRDNFDKILVNLISNALKYTPKGGSVDVSTGLVEDSRLGRSAYVKILDTGVGLDSKTEAFMFERFYRGHEQHMPGTDGIGIGLDLCRRLAVLHHGTISGNNRKDGKNGSVFEVRIPINPDVYSKEEKIESKTIITSEKASRLMLHGITMEEPEPETTKKRTQSNSGVILIVDDDADLRDYLNRSFSSSFTVMEAANGVEALKSIHSKLPDIIISDVKMPDMDGLTLLKQLKSNSDTSHIPVVLLSSKSGVEDRTAGWEKGADAYIAKPFKEEELQSIVYSLLDNRLRLKGKYSGVRDIDRSIEAPEVKGVDSSLLERIMKVTREHIDDSNFNVETLSDEVGISRAHLHRRMKELLGATPTDFIRNVRIRRACELLRKSDIEISQVAYTLGYSSQSHFSTTFKKFTGFTPTEYRERSSSGEKIPEFGTELN